MDINRFFDLLYWLNLEPSPLRLRIAIFGHQFLVFFILLKVFGRTIYFNYKKT